MLQGTLAPQNVSADVIDPGHSWDVRGTEFHEETGSADLPQANPRTVGRVRHSTGELTDTRHLITQMIPLSHDISSGWILVIVVLERGVNGIYFGTLGRWTFSHIKYS